MRRPLENRGIERAAEVDPVAHLVDPADIIAESFLIQ
jgi:hypothetical protein